MKAYYDNKPSVISEVGNGSYLYHYGITEVESEHLQEQTGIRTQYVCEEVTVWSPLTANRITEAVITDRWNANYEQKLVNEYNAAKLGLYDADEAKTRIKAYTDYLTERAALKAQVDADCADLNITMA